jgi:hypothetical protein
MNIPTEEDWGAWQTDPDFDQQGAHESFAGKTREEVIPLFRDNVIWHVSELRSMPAIPFRYYMVGFKDYVLSEEAREDECDAADAASCFLHLVEDRLRTAKSDIAPIMTDLLPALEYVATNQAAYDAEVDIYGDFREQYARIQSLL